jgi:hypothetical protein
MLDGSRHDRRRRLRQLRALDGLTDKASGIEEQCDRDHRAARGRRHGRARSRPTACATGCCRRQRFWGTPDPDHPLPQRRRGRRCPDDQLPVRAARPAGRDLKPKGTSPLAAATDWVTVACPTLRAARQRDTDTMDTFVDSSWYFLRYCSPARRPRGPFDRRGGARDVGARGPVRRRRRARDSAPAVRALLHQGAARHGHGRASTEPFSAC